MTKQVTSVCTFMPSRKQGCVSYPVVAAAVTLSKLSVTIRARSRGNALGVHEGVDQNCSFLDTTLSHYASFVAVFTHYTTKIMHGDSIARSTRHSFLPHITSTRKLLFSFSPGIEGCISSSEARYPKYQGPKLFVSCSRLTRVQKQCVDLDQAYE